MRRLQLDVGRPLRLDSVFYRSYSCANARCRTLGAILRPCVETFSPQSFYKLPGGRYVFHIMNTIPSVHREIRYGSLKTLLGRD